SDDLGRAVLALFQALHEDDKFAAEWVFAGQITIGKRLVDDDDVALLGEFLVAESATGVQRNVHDLEIEGTNDADVGNRKIGESAVGLAEDVHSGGSSSAGERRSAIHADGTDAGKFCHLRE